VWLTRFFDSTIPVLHWCDQTRATDAGGFEEVDGSHNSGFRWTVAPMAVGVTHVQALQLQQAGNDMYSVVLIRVFDLRQRSCFPAPDPIRLAEAHGRELGCLQKITKEYLTGIENLFEADRAAGAISL
jgi:hypothetical protein